jgi:tetratricopeptide (TPR) repeat protein
MLSMAREGLCVLVCAGLLGALPHLAADPGTVPPARLQNQLAVQTALQRGLDHLQRGNYQAAVSVLESKIALIDGNRRYLNTLRDAYRGYIRELQQAGRGAEVSTYLRRLEILDPGARLDQPRPGAAPKAPAPAPTAARPPKEPAPAPPPRGLVPRGKMDDPFDDANSVQAHKARALLERAERAFATRRFEAAGRLFDEANRLEPNALARCRERWAYCILHTVAQTLNTTGVRSADELRREVQQALTLAPKLERFGQDLLRKIEEHTRAARVEVRHTPRRDGGWAKAETANFCIFHTRTPEYAERIAGVAEATRLAMTRKWFGVAPTPWSPRCNIYVHATLGDYKQSTGMPERPGHSTLSHEGERVVARCIHLRCDDPRLLESTLPHETTHVVLFGRFGRHDVPRWADEGMAVLSEPSEQVNLYLYGLQQQRRSGGLFAIEQLLKMNDYPQASRINPFYYQSVSLVDFLCRQKDPQTFATFLREGLDGGYEPALRKHYGMSSFAELERRWQAHAFGGLEAARR